MKKLLTVLVVLLAAVVSCDRDETKDRINISSPKPKSAITRVSLSDEQKEYVNAGNTFAFNCLKDLYGQSRGGSLVFSPLSLQYALAMVANGASGETRDEITSCLGFGEDPDAMNSYCNKLLNELPALDLNVDLSLSNAMIVSDRFDVTKAYEKILNDTYYAPVEYIDASNKERTVKRINEWAYRNTRGFISPFLSEDDLSDSFVAIILNALYFKAKWMTIGNNPLFKKENTLKQKPFYYADGGEGKADYLAGELQTIPYGIQDGYRILGIPYSNQRFVFFILLPDENDGLQDLIEKLPQSSWKEISEAFYYSTLVDFRFPKFEVESKYSLLEMLGRLGINKAFIPDVACFDRMLESDNSFFIGNVLQKARIKVEEEGTTAAAVTGVMVGESAAPVEPPKAAVFHADHPFVYLIAEKTSGVILFEGVYTGK